MGKQLVALFSIVALSVATLLVGVFAWIRTTAWGPSQGDASVWFALYEWKKRGNSIYEGIFDHKDFGFLASNSLFYEWGGVLTVYLFSFVLCLAWGLGLLIILRRSLSPRSAWAVTLVGAAIYVASPSFLSVYTEHYSISLAVLAVAFLRNHPMLSGILLGLALSIKLSVLVIIVTVVIVSSLNNIRTPKNVHWRKLTTFLIGVGISIGGIVLLAHTAGSLAGWHDVISYNREYAAIRNSDGFLGTVYFFWLDMAQSQLAVLLALTLAIAVAGMSQRRTPSETHLVAKQSVSGLSSVDWVAWSLGLATVLSLLPQHPLSFHHLQFAVGGLLVGVLANLRFLIERLGFDSGLGWKSGLAAVAIFAFVAPQLAVTTIRGAGTSLFSEGSTLSAIRTPATADLNFSEIDSVAIFGGNSPSLDPRVLPERIQLSCRFTYQFSHFMPRYGREIDSCIASEFPDLVIWDDEAAHGLNLPLTRAALEENYVLCDVFFGGYLIFAKSNPGCSSTLLSAAHITKR
jgi:hypothetical protein